MRDKHRFLICTIEICSVLFVILNVLLIITVYFDLPKDIITHYGFDGQPNAFGDKSAILYIAGLNVFTYMLLSVLGRRPDLFNYPVKPTEANKTELYYYGKMLLRSIKFFLNIIFFYISFHTISNKSLGKPFVFLIIIITTFLLFYYIRRMSLINKKHKF